MFNNYYAVYSNTKAALCLSAVMNCEIARDVAFNGEVGPSACYGMP